MIRDMKALVVRLGAIEGAGGLQGRPGDRVMEFHVSRKARDALGLADSLFRSTGNIIMPDFAAARTLARRINERMDAALLPERAVRAGRLNAMALIDEILHDVARLYREGPAPAALAEGLAAVEAAVGSDELSHLLLAFVREYPPLSVYRSEVTELEWLEASPNGVPNRLLAIEELLLLRLANENPAFAPFRFLFDDGGREKGEAPAEGSLAAKPTYATAISALEEAFASLPHFGPDNEDLVTMLRAPMRAEPYSLPGQLDYIRRRWGLMLGERLLRLLGALDLIREEERPRFPGPGPTRAYVYHGMEVENERFSPDRDWMPNVVMMAKSTLVWLHQLSVRYGRDIRTLDAIPDEEIDLLALRGFNALWLIGLWERSAASAEIKRRCGNPEAAASAYSLFDYEIAGELGGWPALENLRGRCAWRGIRLAADMVPNHTGIDSAWVRERPQLFMRRADCPYPGYTFTGPDLSGDGRVGIWLEDHYWNRSDAAVVFKRLDRQTGHVDYIYHGNDGTGLPWSDTAQIDFLQKDAREAVKERILHVARNFQIIRFDAAMVLAKRHFRRLWYPEPGSGGDIPSRSERGLSAQAFDAALPEEFWREVVDMCAKETPDTLLLAEAFWMMEGYFVRTLGMHRVYNSAFMNMLKREENAKYRETIKNTQEFDKDILKRFVNFMNNPDEETAVAQFGKGDKYFGACTLMATLPGLPMFGHGQLEGFEEKYGMEYRRAYRDETADRALVERHEREIFPLLKRRRLFSGVERFLLYDYVAPDGSVNENVFAYSNGEGDERALVVYNNAFARAEGRLRESSPYAEKLPGGEKRITRSSLASALGLVGGGRASSGRERFCVMREQRSELWFIRRSRELAEGGLGVILDGYQSQVFLDFFELEDDERGLYADVCDTLGGAGTPDFSATVQDVALRDLYAVLAALASPELFDWAEELFAPLRARKRGEPPRKEASRAGKAPKAVGDSAKRASPAAAAAGPALAFYAKVRSLMREAAAEEGLRGDSSPRSGASARVGGRKPATGALREREAVALAKRDEAAAKAAVRRFASSLAALEALGGVDRPARGRSAGDSAAARLIAEELALPGRPSLALCYAVLDGIKGLCAAGSAAGGAVGIDADASDGARRITDRYCLDRKLREALRSRGMHGDEAYRAVGFAKALLPRLGNETLASPDPADFLEGCAQDEEMRSMLGFNVFGGVTWFNKERFEEAVRSGALYDSLGRGDLECASVAVSLIAGAAAAGYSYEALSAALAPSGKKRHAKAEPAAEAKKTTAAPKKQAPTKAAKPKPKGKTPIATKPKATAPKSASAKPAAKAKPAPKKGAKRPSVKPSAGRKSSR